MLDVAVGPEMSGLLSLLITTEIVVVARVLGRSIVGSKGLTAMVCPGCKGVGGAHRDCEWRAAARAAVTRAGAGFDMSGQSWPAEGTLQPLLDVVQAKIAN